MQSQRESAMVGLFVLIAGAIFFGAVFAMTGAFAGSTTKFHSHFQFAGGLEPGSTVRYAGGPKAVNPTGPDKSFDPRKRRKLQRVPRATPGKKSCNRPS